MSGVKGRSGGANRIPVAEHVRKGSYRRDRHGPLPAWGFAATSSQQTQPAVTEPPSELLKDLGAHGRRFLRSVFCEFELTEVESVLAAESAAAYQSVRDARSAGDVDAERSDTRRLLALLKTLGIPDLAARGTP